MQESHQNQKKENVKLSKKIQWLRLAVQLMFLVMLVAGLYKLVRPIFVIFLPIALLAGNFFCGWVCPFGTVQEIFGKIGSFFVKKKFKMPPMLQSYLQFSRYLLAGIILSQVAETLLDLSNINAYKTFMRATAGNFAEMTAMAIMGSFLVVALFFERPFCNYFCTEGVRFGLASLTRFFTIKREQINCVHCKKCDKACPMNIQISSSTHIRNPQCINCFKCLTACPVEKALYWGKANPLSKK